MTPVAEREPISAKDLAMLCASDTELYNRTFFPAAFRQKSPLFHKDMLVSLESRANRHVAFAVFRGAAKTTLLRAYTSKRIAYGISRTIMYVSESQDHAMKSLQWLRKAVEFNKAWKQIYSLEPGKKWTESVIEIKHGAFGHTATVIAVGITGQIRGVNIDDYRPDLIVVDDPANEENAGTPEQRKKTSDLFFGALAQSLTPRSDSPDAKMVLLQTPLSRGDLIDSCATDPSWDYRRYGCFDENGLSRWPDRFSTKELQEEKQAYVNRGQVLLWLREKECLLSDEESADFRGEWLKYWDEVPDRLVTYYGIDPVPPPSDREIATGFATKDYEVHSIIGVAGGKRYLLEQVRSRGHEPEWTVTEFFRLLAKWRPLRVRVEGIAYQRTLKWILDQEMKKRKTYVQINAVADKRKKRHRILQAFSGLASAGQLYVKRDQMDFISQFCSYPNVDHDDDLDSAAMALDEATDMQVGVDEAEDVGQEDDMPALAGWRRAP